MISITPKQPEQREKHGPQIVHIGVRKGARAKIKIRSKKPNSSITSRSNVGDIEVVGIEDIVGTFDGGSDVDGLNDVEGVCVG